MKFWYLELFQQIFKFWPIFHWNFAILSSAMIMTLLWRHTWDVGNYFGIYGKRRPLAILWYQLHVSGEFIFKVIGGGNQPLGKMCYKKGLVRRGLILTQPRSAPPVLFVFKRDNTDMHMRTSYMQLVFPMIYQYLLMKKRYVEINLSLRKSFNHRRN